MKLYSISFYNIPKGQVGWKIQNCKLGDINLISGKNASGKTRLINSIYMLAEIISGREDISKILKDHYIKWEVQLETSQELYH